MWEAIKGFFGFEGVSKSALKIVDKIAGTDWTPKEKAEYVLKFMETTKHQSPARRMIATAITMEQFILVMVWLGYISYGDVEKAGVIKEFLTSNINVTLNIIVSFYFISHMVKK